MPKMTMPGGATWQDFELDTKLITPNVLRLKIKPTFKSDLIRKAFKENSDSGFLDLAVDHALTLVEAWDLEDANGSMPCTKELKEKYLEPLFWEEIVSKAKVEPELEAEPMKAAAPEPEKEKPKPRPKWLWAAVLEFAKEFSNFVKN